MNIMIDAAGLKAGGGIQVADSICQRLNRFSQHRFVVVLSSELEYLDDILKEYDNVIVEHYTISNNLFTFLTGRNRFLDSVVTKYKINVVNIVFGPSLWIPKALTVAGFAMAHILLTDSPFWRTLSKKNLMLIKFRNLIQKINFNKLSNCYYTESPYISELLKELYPRKRVETITNSCHQIFDQSNSWDKTKTLPKFKGFTLLTICAPYPHKNLCSIPKVIDILASEHPTLEVRFVLTCEYSDIPNLKDNHRKQIVCLGRVEVNQCPWLYQQSDAMYLPTMLECFSANYVEAMKMQKPILTSNLGFATGLCGSSAAYFNPTDPMDIADKVYKVATDKHYRQELVKNGERQMQSFDTPDSRAAKLIGLIEDYYQKSNI